jgi:hypothetical protein
MVTRVSVGLLWLGFVIYAFFVAPPSAPQEMELITQLSTGKIAGINPAIVALFNLMGILPMIYGCFLFTDGHSQKLKAWPFAVGSFALGAFAVLPYFALRQENQVFNGKVSWFLRVQESKLLAGAIAIATLILLALGLGQGDWSDFFQQWQSDRFIHVMAIDFCVLTFLLPLLVKNDLAHRGLPSSSLLWLLSLIPLVGTLAYLLLRPALKVTST